MEILRQPPLPLVLEIPGALPDEQYDVVIANNQTEFAAFIRSDVDGLLKVVLPVYPFALYDEDYVITIRKDGVVQTTWNDDRTDFLEDLYIRRPLWVVDLDDPDDVELERIIRYLIDSITGGFYYERDWIEDLGLGTDFFPTRAFTREVLEGYENNTHVFSKYDIDGNLVRDNYYPYEMSKDKTSITIGKNPGTGGDPLTGPDDYAYINDQRKLLAARQVRYKNARSDSFGQLNWHWKRPFFPKDFHYIFLVARGYSTLPADITLAADKLKDLFDPQNPSGGFPNVGMLPPGVTEYSTDQFKLRFSASASNANDSTGDRYVDAILDKYKKDKANTMDRLGVL